MLGAGADGAAGVVGTDLEVVRSFTESDVELDLVRASWLSSPRPGVNGPPSRSMTTACSDDPPRTTTFGCWTGRRRRRPPEDVHRSALTSSSLVHRALEDDRLPRCRVTSTRTTPVSAAIRAGDDGTAASAVPPSEREGEHAARPRGPRRRRAGDRDMFILGLPLSGRSGVQAEIAAAARVVQVGDGSDAADQPGDRSLTHRLRRGRVERHLAEHRRDARDLGRSGPTCAPASGARARPCSSIARPRSARSSGAGEGEGGRDHGRVLSGLLADPTSQEPISGRRIE